MSDSGVETFSTSGWLDEVRLSPGCIPVDSPDIASLSSTAPTGINKQSSFNIRRSITETADMFAVHNIQSITIKIPVCQTL